MTWVPHRRLITTSEAAQSIDRPESTIRRWVAEGRLTVTARLGHRPLFLESDVLRVDAHTRAR